MKIIAHRTGTCFLLLLIAVPIVYAFCFHIKQFSIRQQMKEKLEQEMLLSVTVAEDQIKWVKPGKEAWVNGRLFDVKTQSCGEGLCTITGFYDDEETALVIQLQMDQQHKTGTGDETMVQLFELLQDVFKTPLDSPLYSPVNHPENFSAREASLSSVSLAIITPPPQS